jgi:multicomponent Na+:H+ antiporter subunit G
MTEIIIAIIATIGAVFVLLAAIGVLKMPDLFLRISVTTKAATLGVGLMLVGVTLHFSDFYTTTRSIAIVLFVFLTAPIGAHLIGRAAYIFGVPLWKNNRVDQLEGHYHRTTHNLHSERVVDAVKREHELYEESESPKSEN